MANLDPSCMTCGNATTAEKRILYEQFKLACLQYKPSDIEVQNHGGEGMTLTRSEVLSNRRQIIDRMSATITENPRIEVHRIVRQEKD
jgi:hypothetical protein